MKVYPNQPSEFIEVDEAFEEVKRILEDDLPDCNVNSWFIQSLYFANMIDKITIATRAWKSG